LQAAYFLHRAINATPPGKERARLQVGCGNALCQQRTGSRKENIEAAIRHYEAALQVYTREAAPHDWAMTQNDPGKRIQRPAGGGAQGEH
jgi:predicted LPLAT superfamily acyltransferase